MRLVEISYRSPTIDTLCLSGMSHRQTEMSSAFLQDDVCRFKKKDVGATDTGYVKIPHDDEDALKEAAATIGPISVAIDASHHSFQLYKSGTYKKQEQQPNSCG